MGYPCASPHAASCTARSRLFGPVGLSASRVGYLDYLRPVSPLYSKTIKPSTFRAYRSDAEMKELEADATDSHQKWLCSPGGRAERASKGPSVIILGAQGITVLAILYACVMDRTIRDAKGNEIATLNPFAYARCMVFLQGEKSLDEYARAKATEKERSQKHDEEDEEAKKEDRERRLKHGEEEIMIGRGDAGRIQISIPRSMVQKCITATSTKEWGDLHEDAKALMAAEVEKQAAERLKDRHTRTTLWYT